jgi:chromosome segregation ATPase
MKCPALILVFLLFACGCATHHCPKAKQIPDKQKELEVLCEELKLAALQLEEVRTRLSTNVYSAADQTRDLDYSISAVQQARNRLIARYRKLENNYHMIRRELY